MALEIKQGLKTTQKLSLSAELKHSITVLTLGRFELEKLINEELEKNPCLVSLPTRQELEINQNYAELKQSLLKSYDNSDYTERYNDIKSIELISNNNTNREIADLSQFTSLHAFIENQISMLRLSDYEKECSLIILQYLDDNGFLATDLNTIADNHKIYLDDIKFALETIQKCEPPGVGARSLQECLVLQINRIEKKPKLTEKILNDY
jgi:RNA polymerase sigma-54 factor